MNLSGALFNFGRSPFVANKYQTQKHFYNFRLVVITRVDIALTLVMIYFFFIDLILQSFGLYNTIAIWTLICSCKGKKWHYFYIFIFKEIILVLIFRRKKIILIRSSVHNVLLSEQQYENHSIYLYEIGKFSVRMYIFILATTKTAN